MRGRNTRKGREDGQKAPFSVAVALGVREVATPLLSGY